MQLEMYQAQPQQPVTVVVSTTANQAVAFASNIYESYKSRQSVISGIILITAGVLSIIFSIASIYRSEIFGFIGHGIWCGVLVRKICCSLFIYLVSYLFICSLNSSSNLLNYKFNVFN